MKNTPSAAEQFHEFEKVCLERPEYKSLLSGLFTAFQGSQNDNGQAQINVYQKTFTAFQSNYFLNQTKNVFRHLKDLFEFFFTKCISKIHFLFQFLLNSSKIL